MVEPPHWIWVQIRPGKSCDWQEQGFEMGLGSWSVSMLNQAGYSMAIKRRIPKKMRQIYSTYPRH